MRPELRRLAIATAIGVVVLAALVKFSGLSFDSLHDLDCRLAILAVAASALTVSLRALGFWLHAPSDIKAPWHRWLALTARHQLLFILLPSGSGDLSFPALAKTMMGISPSQSTRMIGVLRLRDATVIAILLAIGLLLVGGGGRWAIPGALAALIALYLVDDLASFALRLITRIIPGSAVRTFLENAIPVSSPGAALRAARSFVTLLVWLSAAVSLMLAFMVAGRPLSPGEALMMLVTLNLIGAMALTVGNLGFAEAGAVGLLIGFGDKPEVAAATALVARPLMLLAMIAACLTLHALASLSPGARR